MQCDLHLETRVSIRPSLLLTVGAKISVKNIIYEVRNGILPSLFIANGINMKRIKDYLILSASYYFSYFKMHGDTFFMHVVLKGIT
jgi:hypothetical protein